MKKKFMLVTSLILIAILFSAIPVLAGPLGSWVTDFTLFNLNNSTQANVMITRFTQCSTSPCSPDAGTTVASPTIGAGGSYYYNPALDPTFPTGFSGSIVISSDQPIAGTVTLANDLSGPSYASDAYSAVSAPATTTYLPIVLRMGIWSTRITVQNTGATNTNVTIHYIGSGAPTDTSISNLPPNMMAMVDLSDMGSLNFNGSATVTSTNAVATVVEEYKTTGGVLITYNGVPSSDKDTIIYMPGFIAQGTWATDFTIANGDDSNSADITVTFAGATNTLSGNIPAGGSAYINGYAGVYPSGWTGTVPTSGYYGAATVTSNRGIIVVYNIANSGGGPGNLQAGYVGFPAGKASQDVVVPLIENHYSTGWVTTYSVQSVDGTPANLTLTYSGNLAPNCNPCTYNMPPSESAHTFNQESDGHVPSGFLGGVSISSNKSIVVIADQTNFVAPYYSGGDSLAGFIGFVAQ
jgi:hypothetical protein